MRMLEHLKEQPTGSYLPKFYQDILEMERLMQSANWLKDEFLLALEHLLHNAFIQTADNQCLAVWEEGLGIHYETMPNMESRRAAVLQAIVAHFVVNEDYIMGLLKPFVEEEEHVLSFSSQHFLLQIITHHEELLEDQAPQPVQAMLAVQPMLPCNIKVKAQVTDSSAMPSFIGIGSNVTVYSTIAIGD